LTMPKNVYKAEKVIQDMPTGFWIDVRTLAKKAGLSVRTMSRFLIRARILGIVEHKSLTSHSTRIYLWRTTLLAHGLTVSLVSRANAR